MATLQVPALIFADPESLSCPSSPSVAFPSSQESTKKTMQTTVAIRDEKPHHFKIRPLKQVPVEKRPVESPCVNFDRPFAGPRLELPTLYQLAPNRTASACSFNSLKDDDPSSSRPGTPPPAMQRGRALSSANEAKLHGGHYADNDTGLGIQAYGSFNGSLTSLRSTAGDISQEDIAETLQEYDVSQASFLHPWSAAPDLTFETSNELSDSLGLVTPLTSTPSSESVRKAKSMHVTSADLSVMSTSSLDPPVLGRTAILERRKHTKAFSVSSLSSGRFEEGNRVHSRKRHAIYGDSEWQVDLPASDSHSSSVGSIILEPSTSTSLAYVSAYGGFTGKRKSSRQSSAVRPVSLGNALGFKDSTYIPTVPSLPSFEKSVVLPLRVSPSGLSNTKSSTSINRPSNSRDSTSSPMWPPMVQEMLQELDEAIQEWKLTCFVAAL